MLIREALKIKILLKTFFEIWILGSSEDLHCRLFEDAASVFTGDSMGKPAFESRDADDDEPQR